MQRTLRAAGLTTALVVVAGALVAFWNNQTSARSSGSDPALAPAPVFSATPSINVVRPDVGGHARETTLQCEAHWFESAELFTKVSGYLKSQNVDIGSRVKAGDVLAEIDMPELDQEIALMAASLAQAVAEIKQSRAREKTAEAEFRAAEAAVERANADVQRWEAERSFREKEHQRIQQLGQSGSVQTSIIDEKLYQLQAVEAGLRAAEGAVRAASEQSLAARAEIDLAKANSEVAVAKMKVAEAQLAKAKLMADFARLVAPFDGVVTARGYHRGDFVLAGDQGGEMPVFEVARTDLIRVVVRIPDREVPLTHPGDKVVVEFDALPGHTFEGEIARIAYSEDAQTRTMRAEVDLPNHEGLIVDHMYGRVTIELEPASEGVRIPSTCLVGDVRDGKGAVFVVDGGIVRSRSVAIGKDNGSSVEVTSGLSGEDLVVLRAPPGLSDGARAEAVLLDRAAVGQ